MDNSIIKQRLTESIDVKRKIMDSETMLETIHKVGDVVADTIRSGGKVILCGNGGSASDAQHIAGELVGRFQRERKAWPVFTLNADAATMTAISNDYGYDEIFARQVESFITEKDVFIGISTSGNSENVLRAARKAKELKGVTIGLLGKDGGKMKDTLDYSIIIPCDVTARVQESHITIGHIICEIVEEVLA